MDVKQPKLFLSLFIGLFLIAGCGHQTIIGNSNPALDAKPEKEEIIFWHTYNEKETYIFENIIIPLFEQEYPMIEVKSVRQNYNHTLRSEIISRASTNRPPDVIRLNIVWTPEMSRLGLLYPLDNFKDFAEWKGLFDESLMQSNYYNGKYYGIPLNVFTKSSIYNKGLLEETGEDIFPDTMDELINLIEKNEYVIGIDTFSIWATLQYFYGFGGNLTDPTYTKATGYLDSEKSIAAVNKLLSLYQSGNLVTSDGLWRGILEGNFFMIDEGPWFYSSYSETEIQSMNQETVAAPFPNSNGKRAILGGENIVISKATNHEEAAWTFVKWMTNKESQTLLAQTGLIPTNQSVELSNVYDQFPYYQPYLDSIDDALLPPFVPQWWEVDEIYRKYLELIFDEKITVEEGLAKAAEEIDEVFASKERQ
ncbi:extracellular solute-binding protein [Halalkalibacter flavus]|uniref:extracellular solute-binding protein n=1 Tax=Halalkalibacter flavus TaxID=3090668 RepID=UPI002FC798B7